MRQGIPERIHVYETCCTRNCKVVNNNTSGVFSIKVCQEMKHSPEVSQCIGYCKHTVYNKLNITFIRRGNKIKKDNKVLQTNNTT